jgi:hypothetical protein
MRAYVRTVTILLMGFGVGVFVGRYLGPAGLLGGIILGAIGLGLVLLDFPRTTNRVPITVLGDRVTEILRLAEEQAGDHLEDARRQADQIVAEARSQAQEIIDRANTEAAG